jgi:hypothetical protein
MEKPEAPHHERRCLISALVGAIDHRADVGAADYKGSKHCLAVYLISLAILVTTLLRDRHTNAMSKVPFSPLVHKHKSRWPVRFLGLLMLLMLGPISVLAFCDLDLDTP